MEHLDHIRNDKRNAWILMLGVIILCIASWFNIVDFVAKDYIDDALVEAGVAFGVARGINALSSVLESTAVSFSIGLGTTVSLGEIISPLNDMVTDFSTVMKFAIGSLILQKVLIEIVGTTFFNVLITLTGGIAVASFVFGWIKYQLVIFKTFVTFVVLRYLVVLMALLSGVASQMFLEERLQQDLQALGQAQSSIENIEEQPKVSPKLKAKLQSDIDSRKEERMDLNEELSELSSILNDKSEKIEELEAQYEALPASERFNPLSSSEDGDKIKTALSETEQEYTVLEDRIEETEEKLAVLDADLDILNKQIRGESTGFFDSVGNAVSAASEKFSQLKNKFSYENLKDGMSNAIDAMMSAIVSFLLRAVLLPLLFLYLVSRFFKVVWNVDLGDKFQQATKEAKTHLKKKSDVTEVKS